VAEIRLVKPVKLFCGIIAVNEDVIVQAEEELRKLFGEIDVASHVIPFSFTDYYRSEMGKDLIRKFVSFSHLMDPGRLAFVKVQTNNLEKKLTIACKTELKRSVNLDPGYVCPDKIVLASTKNFSHRVYLGDGIYAEVTLTFSKHGCGYFDWTYPDFKSGEYTQFFLEARRRVMRRDVG